MKEQARKIIAVIIEKEEKSLTGIVAKYCLDSELENLFINRCKNDYLHSEYYRARWGTELIRQIEGLKNPG